MREVLISAATANVPQYINTSDQYVAHLKFTQCNMANIFQLKKKNKKTNQITAN